MIQTIEQEKDGVMFVVNKSDANKMIRKIGTDEIYSEAIDFYPTPYKYEETEIEIMQEFDIPQL